MAIAYMEVGKGRKQDAEALSASDYLSLKYMDVLNAENAGAFFCLVQIFHKLHVQPIFLGSRNQTDYSRFNVLKLPAIQLHVLTQLHWIPVVFS
jgi:hypothetical protein